MVAIRCEEWLTSDQPSGYMSTITTPTCTCRCVYGATVEVWPHGADGSETPKQGHVADVVNIDGRKHLVVTLDD